MDHESPLVPEARFAAVAEVVLAQLSPEYQLEKLLDDLSADKSLRTSNQWERIPNLIKVPNLGRESLTEFSFIYMSGPYEICMHDGVAYESRVLTNHVQSEYVLSLSDSRQTELQTENIAAGVVRNSSGTTICVYDSEAQPREATDVEKQAVLSEFKKFQVATSAMNTEESSRELQQPKEQDSSKLQTIAIADLVLDPKIHEYFSDNNVHTLADFMEHTKLAVWKHASVRLVGGDKNSEYFDRLAFTTSFKEKGLLYTWSYNTVKVGYDVSDIDPAILQIPLADAGFGSARSLNCLVRRGHRTINDLLQFDTEKTLNEIPNFGKKCLTEVQEALANYGLAVRTE